MRNSATDLARLPRTVEDLLARLEGRPVVRASRVLDARMEEWQKILVVLEGSPGAEPGAVYAQRIAEASDGCVILACTPRALPDLEAEAHLQSMVTEMAVRVRVQTTVLSGNDGGAIVDELERSRVDLVVMSAAGRLRQSRWLSPNPVDFVLAHSSVPALITRGVKSGSERTAHLPRNPRLLVPLDTSTFAETALPLAASLAELLEGGLVLAQALPSVGSVTQLIDGGFLPYVCNFNDWETTGMEYLSAIGGRLSTRFRIPEPRLAVWHGLPAEVITAAARLHEVALIVMAIHASTGFKRLLRRGVANTLLNCYRDTPPLLLVRPRMPAS